MERKQYQSTEACFADRKPSRPDSTSDSPTPTNSVITSKLPFIEGTGGDCFHAQYAENCTGTESYCGDIELRAGTDDSSPEMCLASRDPKPSNLPWKEPPAQPCQRANDDCMGTSKWCRYQQARPSSECLSMRVPSPTSQP